MARVVQHAECKQVSCHSARNVVRGHEAVKKLQEEGLAPEFLHLDISSPDSIQSAKKELEDKYGRLDVLINNAAILNVSSIFVSSSC